MEKGNYDLFLIDDQLKSSRIRIPQSYVELESEIYIYVFISKPKSKCVTVPAPLVPLALYFI